MQHYVATRPMFIDVEIMNTDIQIVLGDEGTQADSDRIADCLSTLYKEIAGICNLLICILGLGIF
jgi:exocyst complex component 5